MTIILALADKKLTKNPKIEAHKTIKVLCVIKEIVKRTEIPKTKKTISGKLKSLINFFIFYTEALHSASITQVCFANLAAGFETAPFSIT